MTDLIKDIALNVYRTKKVGELAKQHKISKSYVYSLIHKLRAEGVVIPKSVGSVLSKTVENLKETNPEIFQSPE